MDYKDPQYWGTELAPGWAYLSPVANREAPVVDQRRPSPGNWVPGYIVSVVPASKAVAQESTVRFSLCCSRNGNSEGRSARLHSEKRLDTALAHVTAESLLLNPQLPSAPLYQDPVEFTLRSTV